MKKNVYAVNGSTSKDSNYKRRIVTKGIHKTTKIQPTGKQKLISESIQQNNINEQDKNIHYQLSKKSNYA